jgi:hypothetical protein
MIAAALVGAGAGLIVGAIARKKARDTIARELLVGSRRMSDAVTEGRATLLQTAPPQIREGVDQAVTQGLQRAGLTEAELRVLLGQVRRLQRYL